jgi:hypothetical protein
MATTSGKRSHPRLQEEPVRTVGQGQPETAGIEDRGTPTAATAAGGSEHFHRTANLLEADAFIAGPIADRKLNGVTKAGVL